MIQNLIAAVVAFITSLFSASLPSLPPAPQPPTEPKIGVIAHGLQIPWAIDFLPDGNALFTERVGRLNLFTPAGEVKAITTLAEVRHIGEGGLLGLAIDPNYTTNNYIYLYYTYAESEGNTQNRVVRYTFTGFELLGPETIIDAIPGAANHNGGRLKFGPDGRLYITTGDASDPSRAQDPSSLAGKILTWDGQSVGVLSLGHRNPQGLAWDESGQLWATEHGPSAHDELNQIESGQNYGWPTIVGTQTRTGLVSPVVESGISTWAPAGMAYYNQALYFAGLRGEGIYKFAPALTRVEKINADYGRIRDITLGPDGYFYILTSNRDGRGSPSGDDDRIIRLHPDSL